MWGCTPTPIYCCRSSIIGVNCISLLFLIHVNIARLGNGELQSHTCVAYTMARLNTSSFDNRYSKYVYTPVPLCQHFTYNLEWGLSGSNMFCFTYVSQSEHSFGLVPSPDWTIKSATPAMSLGPTTWIGQKRIVFVEGHYTLGLVLVSTRMTRAWRWESVHCSTKYQGNAWMWGTHANEFIYTCKHMHIALTKMLTNMHTHTHTHTRLNQP